MVNGTLCPIAPAVIVFLLFAVKGAGGRGLWNSESLSEASKGLFEASESLSDTSEGLCDNSESLSEVSD